MCGILGIVATPGETSGVDRRDVLRMRDTMTRRGPDGAGFFQRGHVTFAHRRLAIRDAAGGAQPWLTEDGQSALVYNGEIYNDRELRKELLARGHRFRSQCDTEIVMAAWREWGVDCVERLSGMFAFGIYDFRDDTLFLARDRCGIKPLFFTTQDSSLVFASTLAALLAHPRVGARPHWPAISHYLTTFRLTLGRETVYEDLLQLLPAERLIWKRGQITIETYWTPPRRELQAPTYYEAVDHLEFLLQDSVDSQQASDVPVGMFLSGGVDSSTIACLVKEGGAKSMIGHCGGGAGDVSDDYRFARKCADLVEFDYGESRVGPNDYFDRWMTLIDEYATPISTPSDVIIQKLSEEMRKSVGVVLGGEGADEALCGYGVQHWSGRDCELADQAHRDDGKRSAGAESVFKSSLRAHYGRDSFASAADHYFALNSLIPSSVKPALLQPDIWRAAEEDRPMWELYALQLAVDEEESLLERHRRLLYRQNLESLLSRLDTATMSASLEARVPYTDHRFVEAAFRLPISYLIDIDPAEQSPDLAAAELDRRGSLRTKRLLRSIARRRMPREMAQRRKASFPTPVAGWLSGAWRNRVSRMLRGSSFARNCFHPSAIEELAANPIAAGMWLWPILNVVIWGDRTFAAA